MVAEALRSVARQALALAADEGLPGEHHFYVSFRTLADGVRVPGFVRDQYPDEMTVVLQNQFWDLEVDDEAFSVSLTFNGARQRIVVPFAALTAFADPSAQLGLRFEPKSADEFSADEFSPSGDDAEGGESESVSPFGGGATVAAIPSASGGGDSAVGGSPGEGAEVVHLDRFRRKNDPPSSDDGDD